MASAQDDRPWSRQPKFELKTDDGETNERNDSGTRDGKDQLLLTGSLAMLNTRHERSEKALMCSMAVHGQGEGPLRRARHRRMDMSPSFGRSDHREWGGGQGV